MYTQVQADNAQMQQRQALVLTGRDAREAGVLGGRKAGTELPVYARLRGQNR